MPAGWMMGFASALWVATVIMMSPQTVADTSVSLDAEVQALKSETLDLNRDLFLLEEELLYPANTQVAVFLSLDVGEFFSLDSVELKLDDKVVTGYLYTPREIDALRRGGVQRLYTGNLRTGRHEMTALLTGKGPQGRDYRRATSLTFEKPPGTQFFELRINDRTVKHQPEFTIRQWE